MRLVVPIFALSLAPFAHAILPRAPLMDLDDVPATEFLSGAEGTYNDPSANTPVQDPLANPRPVHQTANADANADANANANANAGGAAQKTEAQKAVNPADAVPAPAAAAGTASATEGDAAAREARAVADAKAQEEKEKKAAEAAAKEAADAAKEASKEKAAEQPEKKKDAAVEKKAEAAAKAPAGTTSLTSEPVAERFASAAQAAPPAGQASGQAQGSGPGMPVWYTMTLMGEAALSGGMANPHAHARATHLAHARSVPTVADHVAAAQAVPRQPVDPAFMQNALMATHLAVSARATHPGSIPMGYTAAKHAEEQQLQMGAAFQGGMMGAPGAMPGAPVPGGMAPQYGAAGYYGSPMMNPMYAQQQQLQQLQQQQQQQQLQQQAALSTHDEDHFSSKRALRHRARHHAAVHEETAEDLDNEAPHLGAIHGMKDSFMSELEVNTRRHARHEDREEHARTRKSQLSKDLHSLASDPEDSF